MNIQFIGFVGDSSWPHFKYQVTIGDYVTEYSTGIGHISKKREEGTSVFKVPNEHGAEFARVFKPFGKVVLNDVPKYVYRKHPKPSEVAESLLLDLDAGLMSFDEFCDNYGYSNDSIEAFNTYRKCMEVSRKVKRSDLIQYLTDEQKECLGIDG